MFDAGSWEDEHVDEEADDAAVATAELEGLLLSAEAQPASAWDDRLKAAPRAEAVPALAVPETSDPSVELGYVSAYPDGPARPEHLPSKVGGQPLWLLPERLPPADALRCGRCGRGLRLAVQLYCPRPELEHAYHRSLMLFCCGGACLQYPEAWRAFRCNLPSDVHWYVEGPDGTITAHGRERLEGGVAAVNGLLPPALSMDCTWRTCSP